MAHEHRVEAMHGPSGTASVMADIGGDVGAAVLYVPESLAGLEIEIRRVGDDWAGTHTAVRERHIDHRVIWAAFFGSLPAAEYEVRVRGDSGRVVGVDVRGGHVFEATWE
jgi:hypothetical protein